MNYMEIKYNNIGNGVGVRTSLFVSGCSHRCKGCFNYEAWDRHSGQPYTEEIEKQILDSLSKPWVAGLTLLGGEPMMPYNVTALIHLCQQVRELFPEKTIWVYSGWTYEQLIQMPHQFELLKLCDVLVDGKFDIDLFSPKLYFRGSSNQRIIKVQETLETGSIVLHEKNNVI